MLFFLSGIKIKSPGLEKNDQWLSMLGVIAKD